ncbi:hypothetical protein EW146_g6362 [Bondarzewia mesenterica]|uniref:DNA helicase Pif1-like 2B domain-containing protein n=1 Tax=Bondarzewia mesenterica TaxID=1095465 RepID=A0A4S4LQN3_9AGAM|nr:hypothetical protein EW146_g6362 [Bondarzewia mesenterica]
MQLTPESDAFAHWLLEVGSGQGLAADKSIKLPANIKMVDNTMDGLINALYPEIAGGPKPDHYFLDHTILSSKNDTVDDINHSILAQFPGEESIVIGIDKMIGVMQAYPMEYLNSINVSGLPLAHLKIKYGCPLMLLCNLSPSSGLCNGTRMILLDIKSRVLQCRILGGRHAGKVVFILRITIEPSAEDLPISLSRRQFPVHLAFAMTINKAQGQSVKHVSIDLHILIFSHGQLYVALSRCTSGVRIKVLFPEGSDDTRTKNIVYTEVLSSLLNHQFHILACIIQVVLEKEKSHL